MALDNDWTRILAGLTICSIACGFLSLVLNAFCLVAMIKSRMLQKSCSYHLVALLCVADAWQGVAQMIGSTFRLLTYVDVVKEIRQLNCYAICWPAATGSTFTTACMIAIAGERFWMVIGPISFCRHSERLIKVCIPIVVSISLAIGLWGFVGLSNETTVWPCNAPTGGNPIRFQFANIGKQVGLVSTVLLYVGTAVIYYKRKAKVAANATTVSEAAKQRIEREVMRMVMLVCTVYVVFSLTGAVGIQVGTLVTDAKLGAAITQACNTLTIINCAANVLIFPAKSTEMKQAMKSLLGCFKRSSKVKNSIDTSSSHNQLNHTHI